jgi:hypothetical protein
VDLFSEYTYVYLHTAITSEEAVTAKLAFEINADTFGVKIKQYHVDNGCIHSQDIKFKDNCVSKVQHITYCGSLPKWKGRKENQGPSGQCLNITTACNKEMTISNNGKSSAICKRVSK